MNKKSFREFLFIGGLFLTIILTTNCDDEISGIETKIDPPVTKILNIPAPNSIDNLYSPILKVGWKGISENSIIKGYWVSWESEYLLRNEKVSQEAYFTEEVTQVIPFPSADSLNKQILFVRAEDQEGNIDPVGDKVEFYTSKTTPPETMIEFPYNNYSAFLLPQSTITWKGVKIYCTANTGIGRIKDYALRIDGGQWSEWQSDSIFTITKANFPTISKGKHLIEITSRNTALVEDVTPAQVTINFVEPSHEKEWLIIDDTKDQNGSTERPDDFQVDQFYDNLLSDVNRDSWDMSTQGMIPKDIMGQYKYVLWHSDEKSQTSLPRSAGVISDYLNTKGRLLVSGWNYMSFFDPEGDWTDSIKYYGNILRDYFHVDGYRTIDDALLDTVLIANSNRTLTKVAIDTNKIWSFRNGLYKVIDFRNPGDFTQVLFGYSAADTTDNDYMYSTIGMGYNNSEYQLVVCGFPLYYLTDEGAKIVFLRAKEYLETDFPF